MKQALNGVDPHGMQPLGLQYLDDNYLHPTCWREGATVEGRASPTFDMENSKSTLLFGQWKFAPK